MVYVSSFEGDKSFSSLHDLFLKLKDDNIESSILKEGILPDSLCGVGFFNIEKEKLIGDWKHVVESVSYLLFPQNTPIKEVANDLKYGYLPYSSSLIATYSYSKKSMPLRRGFFGSLGFGDISGFKTLKRHGEISFLINNIDFVNVINVDKEKCFYLIHKDSIDFLENLYFKNKRLAL